MRAAVSFLTPFGGARAPGARTFDWFPVVGAAIGLVLGGVWWAATKVWPPAVAAAVVVGADLGLTGLLHFDGLVDSADGLLPHLGRDRRLAVMASPEAGAFGVTAAAGVILLRWAALDALRPGVLLLAGLWCLSRTGMALVARTQPYAHPGGGLASSFEGRVRWIPLVAGLMAGVGLVLAWRLGPGAATCAGVTVAAAAVVWLARRQIGGYSGDVLGALGIVGETAGLLVAAAKW